MVATLNFKIPTNLSSISLCFASSQSNWINQVVCGAIELEIFVNKVQLNWNFKSSELLFHANGFQFSWIRERLSRWCSTVWVQPMEFNKVDKHVESSDQNSKSSESLQRLSLIKERSLEGNLKQVIFNNLKETVRSQLELGATGKTWNASREVQNTMMQGTDAMMAPSPQVQKDCGDRLCTGLIVHKYKYIIYFDLLSFSYISFICELTMEKCPVGHGSTVCSIRLDGFRWFDDPIRWFVRPTSTPFGMLWWEGSQTSGWPAVEKLNLSNFKTLKMKTRTRWFVLVFAWNAWCGQLTAIAMRVRKWWSRNGGTKQDSWLMSYPKLLSWGWHRRFAGSNAQTR